MKRQQQTQPEETVHSRQQGSYFENGYVRFYAVDPEIPNHSIFHWSSLYAPEVGTLLTLVLPKRKNDKNDTGTFPFTAATQHSP